MCAFNMQAYMQAQCEEIMKHKWISSQKAGYDRGTEACMEWIKNHAKDFRNWAEATGKFKIG
jgi:predicted transcriptional regulator